LSDSRPPRASHRNFLDRPGTLSVVRPTAARDDVEVFLVLADDGSVTAFNGHVDLGTGVQTALAQIVAEELDLPVARITMVLGDTARVPDQGPTIASETIQISAVPLRRAAAQARQFLLELAAAKLGRNAAELRTADGWVLAGDGTAGAGAGSEAGREGEGAAAGEREHDGDAEGRGARLSYESLLEGRTDRLVLSDSVSVKAVADYRVVGRSVQRVDIAAKATGQAVYVHDVRVAGMLHGRVVRPPYAGLDSGAFVGTSLLRVDESSVAALPGIVAVVVIRDFVGIVAEREEQAAAAAERLRVTWKSAPAAPDMNDARAALSANPGKRRTLLDQGAVDRRLQEAGTRMPRTYIWPYQLHASIGPSCAVADYRDGALKVWSGTQNPLPLRADLSLLLNLPEPQIEIVRLEASGCYGRNCADDVAADAALLSRAAGRPVRVQLTREQENLWEPKGAAQVMQVDGGLAADGTVAAYDFSTCYPSNAAPTLALLLTGAVPPVAAVSDMGDRTAIPPYRFEHMRVVVHDMAPIVRASWLRGVSALPNSFAHECYVDELAAAAHVDPIKFRLGLIDDERAAALIKAVAQRADWRERTEPRLERLPDGRRRGQGAAYARYLHGKFPGTAAAWSAWVAEVEVDVESGAVQVTRVVVGQDAGLAINPAGVQHQIHGNVIQSISRTLKEQVSFDGGASITNREWGAYPILRFPEVPVIQVVMMPRPQEPPLGAGESASVPSAAAIANAIFDATGVRMREPPFTPERVRAALQAADDPRLRAARGEPADSGVLGERGVAGEHQEFDGRQGPGVRGEAAGAIRLAELRALGAPPQQVPRPLSWMRRLGVGVGVAIGVAIGLAMTLFAGRASIAPTAAPDPSLYSSEAIARGRQLAALGDCAECHTAAEGATNAGGRRLDTPFGAVYTTNITPDVETGIGGWSYAAFERAMREGLHRDGRHLYPAFPYSAFAKTADRDLQALYAFLMSQPPVSAAVPATRLSFPFNVRPLLTFWNALFLRAGEFVPDPVRSSEWNRGAYLVEGLGHCGGCHSPRNVLGAERGGSRHLAGGRAEGWDAPALTAVNGAPIAWSEAELFSYLRTGTSRFHGSAAGPMQAVTANLAQLPEDDVRAMAHYLASFNAQLPAAAQEEMAHILEARAIRPDDLSYEAGARLFEGACASCHEPTSPTLLASLPAARPSLALNTNMHNADPNNVLRAVLDGVNVPALGPAGAMPAFRASFDDRQVADLLAYLRARFANDKPAWTGLAAAAARRRAE
jgi:nicotinate dehydrogenase subunit B